MPGQVGGQGTISLRLRLVKGFPMAAHERPDHSASGGGLGAAHDLGVLDLSARGGRCRARDDLRAKYDGHDFVQLGLAGLDSRPRARD